MAKALRKGKDTESATTDGKDVSQNGLPPTRQLIVHTQYVKDLSFENPNAPRVLVDSNAQPDVEITVNVGAQLVAENQYEVSLTLTAKATSGDTAMFLVDLTFAGLMTPEGVTPDEINPMIMIEGPRLLFPFARAIVSDATRDGGFMPLNIQPIDFVAVYHHNLAQQAAAR